MPSTIGDFCIHNRDWLDRTLRTCTGSGIFSYRFEAARNNGSREIDMDYKNLLLFHIKYSILLFYKPLSSRPSFLCYISKPQLSYAKWVRYIQNISRFRRWLWKLSSPQIDISTMNIKQQFDTEFLQQCNFKSKLLNLTTVQILKSLVRRSSSPKSGFHWF